ncbi:MAG: HPr(Ser) kinase/phosphatase [Acidobacteria bacterium]|nr:HPr(Ser) kinase/phosphatase [Acidobacteriota bacterium]MCA1611275.1 HPr(Ser) kinase/phosphatase [Acidobacteriota bacterium]
MSVTTARRGLTADVLRSPALADLALRTVAGETGFGRVISWGRIQRPGLALAGYEAFIKPGRIQILGESELNYLDTMAAGVRSERIAAICALPVAAFVVTKGQRVPEDLIRECRVRDVPLLVSDQTTSVVIQSITRILEDELAPSTTVHGVLVDVYGMGVLLLGDSGIGKSECALDLIQRGHRLVADDVVEIRKYPNGSIVGRAAEMIRYHMELRGIGIINIKHLFGVSAVRASKSIELVIELQRWDPAKRYDRLGLDGEMYTILDRPRPLLRLPVASGRNIALLIEIAARNELLKTQGYDAAKEFALKVDEQIAKNMQALRETE